MSTQALDTSKLLEQILGQNKSELSSLAQKASTPIPGGHVGGIPLSLQPDQKQAQVSPLIPSRPGVDVVGKGNARGVGIGNAVIGAMNAISKTETAITNKKKIEVASGTQQLLVAQQAYDQAAELYKQNPQDAEAKAAMDRNMNVMNGILSNDKLRKAIAKGMNIDFTDPSANDTVEHQGVAQGKQMAQQHVSYGEQFNQKTPTMMQPNEQAIAQYKAAVEQQKINTDAVKSIIPLLSAQLRAASMDKRTAGIITASKIKEIGAAAIQDSKNQAAWNRTLANIKSRKDLAKDQFGYKMSEIAAEGQKDLTTFRAKLEMKNADPLVQAKAYTEFQTKSAATIANLTKTIGTLEQEKTLNPDKTGATAKDLNDQIKTAQEALTNYQTAVKSTSDWYKQYAKIGADVDAGADTSTESDKLSNPDTYLNSGTDDESGSNNPDE